MSTIVLIFAGILVVAGFLYFLQTDANRAFFEGKVVEQMLAQVQSAVVLAQGEAGKNVAATGDLQTSLVKTGFLKSVPTSSIFDLPAPVLMSEYGSTQGGDGVYVIMQLPLSDKETCRIMAENSGNDKVVPGSVPYGPHPFEGKSGCFQADGRGGPMYRSGNYYAFMHI